MQFLGCRAEAVAELGMGKLDQFERALAGDRPLRFVTPNSVTT
jgi:hypothetical protein